MRYDCILIGASSAGLLSALLLQKEGKKVLILEKNYRAGGFSSSFCRGQFLFDITTPTFFSMGNRNAKESLFSIFKDLNLLDNFSFTSLNEAYFVISLDSHEKYSMPYEVSKYILQMEEYVPESLTSIQDFFDLAKEVYEALIFIQNHSKVDEENICSNYPNFAKVAAYSVDVVLEALHMPKKAQEILTATWMHFGCPTNILSFVQFASKMYEYLEYGSLKINMSQEQFNRLMVDKFESLGGDILYGSKVTNVLMENGKPIGVHVLNGNDYFSDYFISSVSPSVFYGFMIPNDQQVERANRLCNARTLGAQLVNVYIGLSESADSLSLIHDKYIICDTMDSSKEYLKTKEVFHDSCVVSVLPNYNDSNNSRTILQFSSLYFEDNFSKFINEKNYFEVKKQIAQRLIDAFEEATEIEIHQSISEIEVLTPVEISKIGGTLNGSIYGYMPKGYDNLLPRLLNKDNEDFLPNVRFCGSFASISSAYEDIMLSGSTCAYQTLQNMKGEVLNGDQD